jgi:predicted dehydrogenase
MTMRVGIIGCGSIGQKRSRAALALGHEVACAADLEIARAEMLLRSGGSGGRATTDWRTVIETRPDIVVVATTHDRLAEISLAAVEAGCHVLVEKPAARNAAELAPVIAAVERSRVVLKVGFNHRFHPALLKARQLVDSGTIGPLMYVRGRYGHGGRPGYEKEWRCVPAVSGGGELIDQGAHLIDLSRWFLGDFTEIQGMLATFFWAAPVEDNCFVAMRTPAGQIAWLHATWTEWKNLFSFEIYGRFGKLQVEGLGGSYGVERLTLYRMLPEMGPPETTSWEFPFTDRSWEAEFTEFASAIANARQPIGSIYDAKAALDIVGKLYGDARR